MRLIDANALKEIIGECPENWTDSPEEVTEFNMWHRVMDDIDSCQTIGDWISVEDKTPDVYKDVLVYAVGKTDDLSGSFIITVSEMFMQKKFPSGTWHETWFSPWEDFNTYYKITHWMPLPNPPKEDA